MKWKIYSIFFVVSLILSAIILRNFSVESDIYTLLNLDEKDRQITQNMRESLSNEIIFLSDSAEVLNEIKARNKNAQIFSIFSDSLMDSQDSQNSANNFTKILDSYKLATINRQTYQRILSQGADFMRESISNIFNAFDMRIIPFERDFLNLSAHSTLLKSNISIDSQNGRFFVESDGKKYFVARGILSTHFKSNALLNFIAESKSIAQQKNAILLVSGGAIFSAVGESRGNIESIYMSVISLALISILLFSAFGSVQIFRLIFVIAFAFLCGLAGTFALIDKVHILSIAISTSLIGLVLDFSMHFLSLNYKRNLPITHLKKIFIIGLGIACSGYAIFFFSPMNFLHQIATISIFTLFGAMIATYFLLPQMIDSSPKPTKIFRFCLINYILWLKRLNKKWLIFPCALVILSIPFLAKFDFSDNIKSYYAPPNALISETIEISNIMQDSSNTQFITLYAKDSSDLIEKERKIGEILKQKGVISDYDGISKIFLSPKEQSRAKQVLLDSAQKNASYLQGLGFEKETIKDFSNQIKDLEIIDFSDNLYNIFEIFKLNRFLVNALDSRESSANSAHLMPQIQSIMFLKNPNFSTLDSRDKSEIDSLLDAHNARFIDFNASINNGFESIKYNAILLKILAFGVAFVILGACFGLKMGLKMTLLVLCGTVLSLCVLVLCGVNINIFSIFGLILASVVGIDYMIFALYKSKIRAVLGIILASLTSIISFVILATSHFGALFAFGIATSLCMCLCALFASVFAFKKCDV